MCTGALAGTEQLQKNRAIAALNFASRVDAGLCTATTTGLCHPRGPRTIRILRSRRLIRLSEMSASRHLKEQDELFDYILRCITQYQEVPMSIAEAFAMAELLLAEHRRSPTTSRLLRYCPHAHPVFADLKLEEAFWQYDAMTNLSQRRFVPPTFAEVRRIFNLATVHASAPNLRLLTLDADDTIYGDGLSLTVDSPMIPLITKLLKLGVHVSL
jgi:IMP and pyridine-specific 5'-nucleotidase